MSVMKIGPVGTSSGLGATLSTADIKSIDGYYQFGLGTELLTGLVVTKWDGSTIPMGDTTGAFLPTGMIMQQGVLISAASQAVPISINRIYGAASTYVYRLGLDLGFVGSNIDVSDQNFEINIPSNCVADSLTFTYSDQQICSVACTFIQIPLAPGATPVVLSKPYKIGCFGVAQADGVFFDQSFGLRAGQLLQIGVYENTNCIQAISVKFTSQDYPLQNYFDVSGANLTVLPQPSGFFYADEGATNQITEIRGVSLNTGTGVIAQLEIDVDGVTQGPFGDPSAVGTAFTVTIPTQTALVHSFWGWASSNGRQSERCRHLA